MDEDDIVDRWRGPLHKVTPRSGYPATHRASRANVVCGDEITLLIFAREDRVEAAHWDGEACCLTCAVTDALCERIVGLSLAEALAVDPFSLVQFDIGINRRGCVTLPAEVLKEALRAATPDT